MKNDECTKAPAGPHRPGATRECRPRPVTELGFLAYNLAREARCPKGQRGRMNLSGELTVRPENPERLRRVRLSNLAHLATARLPRSPSSSSTASSQARREALSCDCGC